MINDDYPMLWKRGLIHRFVSAQVIAVNSVAWNLMKEPTLLPMPGTKMVIP